MYFTEQQPGALEWNDFRFQEKFPRTYVKISNYKIWETLDKFSQINLLNQFHNVLIK